MLVYDPFMRSVKLTSAGYQNFHAKLIQTDLDIGYKDDLDMLELFANSGLSHSESVEMPTNNLGFVLKKGFS